MARVSKKWTLLATLAISTSSMVASSTSGYAATTQLTWFSDVNWWTMGQWTTKPGTVEGAITQKTGLTFNFNVPAQDADTKLNLMMVTGRLPDVMSLSNYTTVEQLVKAGKVWSITDLMQKYDPGFLKTFPKDLETLQNQQFGGFYGIPSYATSAGLVEEFPRSKTTIEDTSNQEIVVNAAIMKKAGITMAQLRTEDGLLAALKKVASLHLTYKGAPVIPLQIDNKDAWMSQSVDTLAQMFGAMPVDKQGKYRPLMLAPDEKHAIDFLFKAAQVGALDKSELTLDETATNSVGSSGRVFAFLGNMANPHFEGLWTKDHTQVSVSPGNILSNQHTTPTFGYGAYPGWTFTLVSKTATNPQAIAKWIDFMWSPEGQRLNAYGFQGKYWNYNKQGYVVMTPAFNALFKKDPNTWETTGLTGFWFFTNQAYIDQVTPPPTKMPDTMITQLQEARAKDKGVYKYDNTALSMPADLIPPASRLFQDQQQIKQYWETQVASMIFAKDTATENSIYQQTISQLHKMGLDQIDFLQNSQFLKQEKSLGQSLKGVNS